jgi:tryptophan-rich sensory protein
VGFIFTIIGLMVSLDLVWWIVFVRLTNHGAARIVVSVFMFAMMVGFCQVLDHSRRAMT